MTKNQIKVFEMKISQKLTIIFNRFNSQLDIAEKKLVSWNKFKEIIHNAVQRGEEMEK